MGSPRRKRFITPSGSGLSATPKTPGPFVVKAVVADEPDPGATRSRRPAHAGPVIGPPGAGAGRTVGASCTVGAGCTFGASRISGGSGLGVRAAATGGGDRVHETQTTLAP